MEIEHEIERFKKDWDIDFPGKRIFRKKPGFFKGLLEIFLPAKYPVIALYRFVQFHLSTETGIVYPDFFERGRGNEITGVPSWFEISEEWNIPEESLKKLYIGPLVQNGTVLVPALPTNGFLQMIWQVIGIISTLGGAITFVFWIFGG